jgi:hypothetical protein
MSGDVKPPDPRECDAVGELLAWYVNGTLSAAECARVEAHMQECAACRAREAFEQRVSASMRTPRDNIQHAPQAGWKNLVARLDRTQVDRPHLDREAGAASAASVRTPERRPRIEWSSALGVAVVIQAAAIVVLALALVQDREPPPEAPQFRTLANEDPTLGFHGALVRIAFDSSVDETAAKAVAERSAAHILAGPSPDNVYTFGFENADAGIGIDQTVNALRREPHVLLVEPVLLRSRDSPR